MILFVISRVWYYYGIDTLFGIREAMISLPFFSLGYYENNSYKVRTAFEKITNINQWMGIAEVGLYIVIIALCVIVLDYSSCHMSNSDIGNIGLFILFGTVGSLVCITVGKQYQVNLIEKLGRNSMEIYGFHYIVLDIYCDIIKKYTFDNILVKLLSDMIGVIFIVAISLMFKYVIDVMNNKITNKLWRK